MSPPEIKTSETSLVRELLLDASQHPRGQAHLSAASGLVRAGSWLYVVADDEHHLGMLNCAVADSGNDGEQLAVLQLLRLFEGDLPKSKGKRKALKPDLEALAGLPGFSGWPHGALFALGSGSRPTRENAVLLALAADGAVSAAPLRYVDLHELYAPLRDQFADLNIEGAFFSGDAAGADADATFSLLQRGNKGERINARIVFSWARMASWLSGQCNAAPQPLAVHLIELGDIDGVPLGLTDGAALPGGDWVFSAVAENTDDSFSDGACAGSTVGTVSRDGLVRQQRRLEHDPKVEGVAVAVEPAGDDLMLTLVTDADDPKQPSQLLRVRLPGYKNAD